MKNAVLMCSRQAGETLFSDTKKFVDRKVLAESLAEGLPLHAFHDYIHTLVLNQDVVNLRYVFVIELGGALGFLQKPIPEHRILAVLASNHLDCDVALEEGVFAQKHLAHSAVAKLCLDYKSADTAANEITNCYGWVRQI